MKNSKILIIALIITLLNIDQLKAEQFPTNGGESKMVLSTSGLNLRQGPSLRSAVIKLVAYGEQVEILEDSELLVDTLNRNTENELIGNWVKVSHQRAEGYMFSSFLAKVDPGDFPTELLDEDYALLLVGCACRNNFQFRRDFEWTGIYKTVSGKYRAKKVNPSYYFKRGAIEDYVCVKTDEKEEEIIFIIGSRRKEIFSYFGQMPAEFKSGFVENNTLNENLFFDQENNELTYCYDNISYPLNFKGLHPERVFWKGDLDADGIEDFIIQHGYKESRFVLYLSSEAKEGELFKAIATYRSGFCC